MSQLQSPPRDDIFDKVFPYHNDQAHTLVNWGSGTMISVYNGLHAWVLSVILPQRARRTLTLDLTAELEALLEEVRDGANYSPANYKVYLSQLRNVTTTASQLWVAVKREESYLRFERNLQRIDMASLMARYRPGLYEDAGFCRRCEVSLSSYIGHIYSEVRKETAAFEIWKHQVNHGDPSRVSQTPPSRIWNQALAGVVHHARDILACGNFPDPLPFESIMRILEQGDSWYRNFAAPGTFISADMFDKLDDDQVAAILVQDMWTMELRYRSLWKDGGLEIEFLRFLIKARMEHFYHRAVLSVSGKMRAVWAKDGTAHGRRIDNDNQVIGFMRFGVPAAKVVNGKVEEMSQEYTIFEKSQSEVEVSLVRDEYVVLWDEGEELPPHYEDVPPTYQSIYNPPTYQHVYNVAASV